MAATPCAEVGLNPGVADRVNPARDVHGGAGRSSRVPLLEEVVAGSRAARAATPVVAGRSGQRRGRGGARATPH
ncbi:hypothetical protein GCM10020220_087270 [Nonomuraea rubra]